MSRDTLTNEYFAWLYDLVCGGRFSDGVSYRKLLMFLHSTEFTYTIPRDKSRAVDGALLRYHFALTKGREDVDYIIDCLDGPCSVLEMMVALAKCCEETIMDDPGIGNRTGEWFWGMITNLGLGSMHDGRFDKREARWTIDRFLSRNYEPDGRGGLFTIRHCDEDLRRVEIWYQLCWYLGTIA